MKKMLPLLVLAATAGCATGPQPEAQLSPKESLQLARALDGKTAGKPVSCISTALGRDMQRIGGDTLIYRVNRKLVYQNKLVGSCRGFSVGEALVMKVYGSQYCRGDIAHVVDMTTGTMTGSCALGDFVPYQATPAS
jgi:hypothetical protein